MHRQWPRQIELPPGVSPEEYQQAERRFRSIYGTQPARLDTLMTLAELAVAQNRPETAVACFLRIPSEHPEYGPVARLQEGQLLARLNRSVEAEASLREFLQLADSQFSTEHRDAARHWLVYILSVQLRFEDRKTILEELHRDGQPEIRESILYHFPHLVIWNFGDARGPLRQYLKRDPDSLVLQVAHGRYLIGEGKLQEARVLLEQLFERNSDSLHCAAALLGCHFERNDFAALARILHSLPEFREGEPWLLTQMRGNLAVSERRWEAAVTCFEQVLRDDPANPICTIAMAGALGKLGRMAEREAALQRSAALAKIRSHLGRLTETEPLPCRELVRMCEEIGLESAAMTFRGHADRIEKNPAEGSLTDPHEEQARHARP